MHRFRSRFLLLTVLIVGLSACSVSVQSPSDPTTTLALGSPASDLVLLDDGLGPFIFGDSSAAVIEGVTATIGGWNADSSNNDVTTARVCVQGQPRIVSWGSLVLTFVEEGGVESFSGWSYGFDPLTGDSEDQRHLGLNTPEGIELGSTRTDLIDVYGSTVSIADDVTLDTASFIVSGGGSTHLAGKLDTAGPGGVVDFLETSPTC